MENCLGITFLENLISVARNTAFGMISLISSWGVGYSGKSHPWTNTSLGENPLRNFQAHWSMRISLKTRPQGDWSIRRSLEIHMDQWLPILSESSGLHSELFAIGPVQFSWPRGGAENWFTKLGFWEDFVHFPRKNSKTQSSLNFLQFGPGKFTKSDFSGLAILSESSGLHQHLESPNLLK